jgi:hypothetical protein
MRIKEERKPKVFGEAGLTMDYFNFLCKITGTTAPINEQFHWSLFAKDFTWTLPEDAARAAAGKKLRDAFIKRYLKADDDILSVLDGPCSILEMLIGLAVEIEAFTISEKNHDYEGRYVKATFNELINNLRLNRLAKDEAGHILNDTLLNSWLERTYSRYGDGGLFPIKWKNCPDQRIRPIWDQALSYLGENYFIGDILRSSEK